MSAIIFDIETGPASDEVITELFVPKTMAEFIGDRNWKEETKQAKYAEYLASARDEFKRSAALSALSGQVLAIGYKTAEKKTIHGQGETGANGIVLTEHAILTRFWQLYQQSRQASNNMIGFNIADFDIPFLVRRSIVLGISVPKCLFAQGKYLDSLFVDLRKVWQAGQYNGVGSLDAICRACGIGAKTEGVDGSMFCELWNGGSEKRAIARQYLFNDLDMTWELASRCNCL